MRPPLPPFNSETAAQKVRGAENAWNKKNPEQVALAYSENSRWRNRAEFLEGRDQIRAFLERKWSQELDYRLVKELWAFEGNRIAVRFCYEYHDASGQWFRAYGNENWEFDEEGLMRLRLASINDLAIERDDLWSKADWSNRNLNFTHFRNFCRDLFTTVFDDEVIRNPTLVASMPGGTS